MTQAITFTPLSDLGLLGRIARVMTHVEDRESVSFADYIGRIAIFIGLMAMCAGAAVGIVGTAIGPSVFEAAGMPASQAQQVPAAAAVLTYLTVIVSAIAVSTVATGGYLAERLGFRAGQRYDLR